MGSPVEAAQERERGWGRRRCLITLPMKIFATGRRRRRQECHQSERMFVRQAVTHVRTQPSSQSVQLVNLMALIPECVGRSARNAALNGRSALLGDSDGDGAAALGMVGDLQCLLSLHQCCVNVHQVRGPVCSPGCPLASLSQT